MDLSPWLTLTAALFAFSHSSVRNHYQLFCQSRKSLWEKESHRSAEIMCPPPEKPPVCLHPRCRTPVWDSAVNSHPWRSGLAGKVMEWWVNSKYKHHSWIFLLSDHTQTPPSSPTKPTPVFDGNPLRWSTWGWKQAQLSKCVLLCLFVPLFGFDQKLSPSFIFSPQHPPPLMCNWDRMQVRKTLRLRR